MIHQQNYFFKIKKYQKKPKELYALKIDNFNPFKIGKRNFFLKKFTEDIYFILKEWYLYIVCLITKFFRFNEKIFLKLSCKDNKQNYYFLAYCFLKKQIFVIYNKKMHFFF